MILNIGDLNILVLKKPLGTIGISINTYEIRRYRDIRNLSNILAYQVMCTQRIIIPNQTPYAPGPQNNDGFKDYPAIVSNMVSFGLDSQGAPIAELMGYSPKTINAAVSSSLSSGNGTSASASHQHTSGSSDSQSNTYGASASLGFFGGSPTGDISGSYSHTNEKSHSTSDSTGGDSGRNSQATNSESMSVKDWACCSYLDATDGSPRWVWGQEYPWNIIKYNNTSVSHPDENSLIIIPDLIVPLMADTKQTLPPSQLSLFGIDFTMKSVWIVNPAIDGLLTIEHEIEYYSASHTKKGDTPLTVNATISNALPFQYSSPTFNVYTYGLDAITGSGDSSGAIVGFVTNKFIVQPIPKSVTQLPCPFRIISANNSLMITDSSTYANLDSEDVGAGFTSKATALVGNFTQHCTALEMTLEFKIVDELNNYSVFLKHWKTGLTGVVLKMTINGDGQNAITKYVDALEAEGGENNLLSISLRNLDYSSVDFHDFLQLGLNTMRIGISPIGGGYTDSGYQLRAISIEKS